MQRKQRSNAAETNQQFQMIHSSSINSVEITQKTDVTLTFYISDKRTTLLVGTP